MKENLHAFFILMIGICLLVLATTASALVCIGIMNFISLSELGAVGWLLLVGGGSVAVLAFSTIMALLLD